MHYFLPKIFKNFLRRGLSPQTPPPTTPIPLFQVSGSAAGLYTEKNVCGCEDNKKFEPRLTRRAKAYSSSCSQTVSLSRKLAYFHEKLVNNGKITTFTGVPLFDALMRRFP